MWQSFIWKSGHKVIYVFFLSFIWCCHMKKLCPAHRQLWQLFKYCIGQWWNYHLFDFRHWKQQLTGSIIALAECWLKPCLKEVWQRAGTITSLSLYDPSSLHHLCAHLTDRPTKPLLHCFCSDAQAIKPTANLCFSVTSMSDVRHEVFLRCKRKAALTERTEMCVKRIKLPKRRYHPESRCDWYIWIHLETSGERNDGNHCQWVTHPSEEDSKWGKRLNHSVIYFYSSMATREIPGFLHMRYRRIDIPLGFCCRSQSLFLSATNVLISTLAPEDDKLAVSFSGHVTSKAKRKEIMILG